MRWFKRKTEPTGYDNCPPDAAHSCNECKRVAPPSLSAVRVDDGTTSDEKPDFIGFGEGQA